jgi:hypothetical protein
MTQRYIQLFVLVWVAASCTGFKWNDKQDPAISSVTSTNVDGSYDVGATITLQVIFTEKINVTGVPELQIATGTPSVTTLPMTGGSGTDTLTFSYLVVAGNNSNDLEYSSDQAFTLGAATITTVEDQKVPSLILPVPGGAGSLSAAKNIAINTAPPTVISSDPADTASGVLPCVGNPCRASFSITFSKPMNTAVAQTLNLEIWNGSAYVATPHSNTTFTWSQTRFSNDTLSVAPGWLFFPEQAQIRYTLAAAGLQDLLAQAIAAQVQRSFSTTGANQYLPATDTGQTSCFNATSALACAVPGYPGQDAEYLNVPRAPNFSTPTPHATFTSDFFTNDNVTGLVWKSCVEGRSGASCATGAPSTFSWYNAINQCAALNVANAGAGYAGLTNWRLPTLFELRSTLKNGVNNPSIDSIAFPNTPVPYTKTISGYYLGGNNAFVVDYNGGNYIPDGPNNLAYVRCVSPTATIVPATYIDNGDGTVSDINNNLRWQKCSNGQTNDPTCSGAAILTNWASSLTYCDNLVLGSHANQANWRLPSLVEFESLTDIRNLSPAIDVGKFPNTPNSTFFTSTTYAGGGTYAWYVDQVTGNTFNFPDTKTTTKNVRCVSTGP